MSGHNTNYRGYRNHLTCHKLVKSMKKVIEIHAVDDEIAIRAKALKILSDFRGLGFTTRKSFLNVVMSHVAELDSHDGGNRLVNFWAGREFKLNDQLENLLENLKQS